MNGNNIHSNSNNIDDQSIQIYISLRDNGIMPTRDDSTRFTLYLPDDTYVSSGDPHVIPLKIKVEVPKDVYGCIIPSQCMIVKHINVLANMITYEDVHRDLHILINSKYDTMLCVNTPVAELIIDKLRMAPRGCDVVR